MNENRHPLDDLFRDGLDQHSVEPPMHVWERIDQTRTPVYKLMNNFKQHSRWYLSVAAGLVFMSAAAVMFLSDKPDLGLVEGQGTIPAVSQTEIRIETPSEEQSVPALAIQEAIEAETPASSTPTASSSTSPSAARPTEAYPATPAPRKNATQTEPITIIEAPVTIENAQVEAPIAPLEKGEVTEQTTEIIQVTEAPSTTPEAVVAENEEIPEMVEAITPNDPSEAPKKNEKKESKTMIPLEPSPWSIEFLGSYDFVNRRMPNASPAYQAARKQDEKMASAYTFQLRAQYRLNAVFSLRSGISYSRINETLNHTAIESYTEITDRQVTGYIVDPINGPTQITYTVRDTFNRSSSSQVNSNNSYTFIDVPVLLNYTLYTSNKWAVGMSGGPIFNLVFQQKGHILSPTQGEIIDLSTSANPFRTYAGVNLMLNATASYSLNKHFDLLFEPGMRFGLSSLTNTPTGINQKYNSLNLFTGIRYNF